MKQIILATAGYFIGTIAVSFIWYAIFSSQYESLNLMGPNQPSNYVIGFINILIIGGVISYLYDYLNSIKRGVAIISFVSAMAGLVWVWYVLATLSWIWQEINNVGWFIFLSTALVILQFAVYGLVLRWVYKP